MLLKYISYEWLLVILGKHVTRHDMNTIKTFKTVITQIFEKVLLQKNLIPEAYTIFVQSWMKPKL